MSHRVLIVAFVSLIAFSDTLYIALPRFTMDTWVTGRMPATFCEALRFVHVCCSRLCTV
jgi:hypothetical protein